MKGQSSSGRYRSYSHRRNLGKPSIHVVGKCWEWSQRGLPWQKAHKLWEHSTYGKGAFPTPPLIHLLSLKSFALKIKPDPLPGHTNDSNVLPSGSVCNRVLSGNTAAAKSLQWCPTLYDPTDGSPPGSSIPGILQARTLEWVAISFSNAWKWKVKVKSLSRVWLLETLWTVAQSLGLHKNII